MMRMGELLAGCDGVRWSSPAAPETQVRGICQDSREVTKGDLFVALPGDAADGRRFIDMALQREAGAVLIEDDGRELPEPGAGMRSVRHELGELAARFHGDPSMALDVVAVTGTNGKTSCSHYVAQLLVALGHSCGAIGTVGCGLPGALEGGSLTTPEPIRLQSLLASFVARGLRAVALEASSHGLVQGRLNGTRIRVAVFTNITRDHLDFHADFAAYKTAKALLFGWPELGDAVINLDDPWGEELVDMCAAPVTTYSANGRDADIQATDIEYGATGVRFLLRQDELEVPVTTQLLAGFNVSNVLAAFGAVRALGFAFDEAVHALPSLVQVRGRMELIDVGKTAPTVMVDYAHSPDALSRALRAARRHCAGRLWVVFGCGGNRDRGKRQQMGSIAAQLADVRVLTSANPRLEDPVLILRDISVGLGEASATELVDRAEASEHAIHAARPGDLVVIAGKGHEDYQETGGQRLPFSDVGVARAALESGSWT